MKIKKLIKYFHILAATTILAVATGISTLNFSNHNSSENPINTSQQNSDADYTDQLQYIRNDVQKQADPTNPITSIGLGDNSNSNNSSAAIVTKTDGSTLLYMWGANQYGQLGDGTTNDTNTPTKVDPKYFNNGKIVQVVLAEYHSAAILEDGSLYMWGFNDYGQLATGSTDTKKTPAKVNPSYFNSRKVVNVALGTAHVAALTEDGDIFTWGWNNVGQLGFTANGETANPIPTKLSLTKIKKIALGGRHSAALLEGGGLYMWGFNSSGQLGTDNNKGTNPNPVPTLVDTSIFGSNKISEIALGSNHSAALLDDGSMYTWGHNIYGQLGDGTDTASSAPIKIITTNFGGKKIKKMSIGHAQSAALLEDNSLYMWGRNNNGQLGIGTLDDVSIPVKVSAFNGKKVMKATLGGFHSAALLDDGNLYMWGNNRYGQLGDGSKIDRSAPTWMYQLGKDSHMSANPAVTAQEAASNSWFHGFNYNGFVKSFNLVNITNVNGQQIIMDKEPTYDNNARTVTLEIKIRYYYDSDGLITDHTVAKKVTIAGFKEYSIKTNINIITQAPHPIVINEWLSYVTVDEKISYSKLEMYLILTQVPIDAEFAIAITNQDNKNGVLSFDISTDKVIDENGLTIETPSYFKPFSLKLNLTPRITMMSQKTSEYPKNLTAAAFKEKLFDDTGLVKNVDELKKYMDIAAPVDGVKYYLVENSWESHTGDGTLKFDIYADRYYDSDSIEKPGSAITLAAKVNFNLELRRLESVLTPRRDLPDIRIDEFEDYVKSAGNIVNTSLLREFFDLENIPSAATFTISDVKIDEYDDDFTRNHLSFNLTIDKFNKGNPPTPWAYRDNHWLILGTQHKPTAITPKTTYDQTIRVDKVANELKNLNGEELLNYLNNLVDFESIPDVKDITVRNVETVELTGELSFEVVPGKIYDSASNLVTPAAGQFTINLRFAEKYAPTDMVINPGYTKVKIDEFAKNMTSLKGQDLYDYLVSDYVIATTVNATELTSRIISQDNQTGKIEISLTIQSYYDENSDPVVEAKTYTFDFQLNPRYQQTAVKTLDTSAYPKDITPAQFKQQIIDGGATLDGNNYNLTPTNITFLKKFLSFDSVPPNTIHTLTWNDDQTDDVTGMIGFNLSLSQHYNANGDLATAELFVNDLTLNLLGIDIPVWPETRITVKANAPLIKSAQSFLDLVYPDDLVDLDKLSLYVDGLQTIPTTASVTNISVKPTRNSMMVFVIDVSGHYDASGTLQGSKTFEINLSLTPKFTPTSITVLPEGSYPSDLTPSRFKQIIIDNVATVDGNAYNLSNTNINFLNRFLDLGTVPPSTGYTLTWNDEQTDDLIGKLGLNLIVNKYYNSDGDLVTNGALPFNDLALNLTATGVPTIWPETVLTSIVDSPTVDSEQEFMGTIYDVDGNLISPKLGLFVDGLATIPGEATIVVEFVSVNEGIAKFTITISSYYDGISETAIIGEKTFDFEVNVKFVPIAPPAAFYWWWWILIVIGAVVFLFIIWLLFKKKHTEEEIQENILTSEVNKNTKTSKNKLQKNTPRLNTHSVSENHNWLTKFKTALGFAPVVAEQSSITKNSKGKAITATNKSGTNKNISGQNTAKGKQQKAGVQLNTIIEDSKPNWLTKFKTALGFAPVVVEQSSITKNSKGKTITATNKSGTNKNIFGQNTAKGKQQKTGVQLNTIIEDSKPNWLTKFKTALGFAPVVAEQSSITKNSKGKTITATNKSGTNKNISGQNTAKGKQQKTGVQLNTIIEDSKPNWLTKFKTALGFAPVVAEQSSITKNSKGKTITATNKSGTNKNISGQNTAKGKQQKTGAQLNTIIEDSKPNWLTKFKTALGFAPVVAEQSSITKNSKAKAITATNKSGTNKNISGQNTAKGKQQKAGVQLNTIIEDSRPNWLTKFKTALGFAPVVADDSKYNKLNSVMALKNKNVKTKHSSEVVLPITEDLSNAVANNIWWKKTNKSSDLKANLTLIDLASDNSQSNLELHNLGAKIDKSKSAKNSPILISWINWKNTQIRVKRLIKTVAVNDVLSSIYENSENTPASNSKTDINMLNIENEKIIKNNQYPIKQNKSNDPETKSAENFSLLTAWINWKNARMRVKQLHKAMTVNEVSSNIYGYSDNTLASNSETVVNTTKIENQKIIKHKQNLTKVDSLVTEDQSNVATNNNWWTNTNKSDDLEVNLDLHNLGTKHVGKFSLLTAWINWKNVRLKVKRLLKTVAVNDVLSNIYVNSDDIPNNLNEKLTTNMNDQSLANDATVNSIPSASKEKSVKVSLHARTKNWIAYHKRLKQLNVALATKPI